ncbi:glucosamine-6-phosphate deaminase [Niallia sp. Krafla_26]|uniref:glucosamine-6-phosphate deaminase n=1 Tax=Niallia sp. Krafla_26 TaxID=3064703 RepID=UPI003D17DE23
MKIIKVESYDQLSKTAAEMVIEKVRREPKTVLGLATGGTPVGLYKELVKDHQNGGTSYKEVSSFNLDEYVGLSGDDPNSYRYFMDEHLFNHVDISKENTHVPLGNTEDHQQHCQDYENLLKERGGVDLQILGIGPNGHIGFNEPGTSFQSETQVVELMDSTREANARFFNSIDEVPTHAISMGIATIMRSKEIILMVSGETKREALAQLLNGEVNENFPASILKNHPNVTVIADKDAVGE